MLCLPVFLSSKNRLSLKKKSQLISPTTQTIAHVALSLKGTTGTGVCNSGAFLAPPCHFFTRHIKETSDQGSRFNEISNV